MECGETPDDTLRRRREGRFVSRVSHDAAAVGGRSPGSPEGTCGADVHMVGKQSVQIEDLNGRLTVRSDKGQRIPFLEMKGTDYLSVCLRQIEPKAVR
jgi:hypothetical protein